MSSLRLCEFIVERSFDWFVDPRSSQNHVRRTLLRIIGASAITIFMPQASSAEKPPIACKRIGQSAIYRGKKYTCIKVKNKLVWDKGVPLSATTPKTTNSPSSHQSAASSPSSTPTPSPSASQPSPAAMPIPTKILFAKSGEIPNNGTVVINGKDQLGRPLSVAFTRSGGVIIALEAFCTHAGCIVRPQGKELACPCHYSIFDPVSGKPGNPSQQGAYPLTRFEVTEESGSVYLWL